MTTEQKFIFPNQNIDEFESKNAFDKMDKTKSISKRIFNSFEIVAIPFLGCDYDMLYPKLASIVPEEKIKFDNWNLDIAIACEIVCAAICHQINWDFLRKAVYDATLNNKEWLKPTNLVKISTDFVDNMFVGYSKIERVRANERALLLRKIGELAVTFNGFSNLFLDKLDNIFPASQIRANLLSCSVFKDDPGEKKLQLLLQKLSNYDSLSELNSLYMPAIDYHLIRSFLRRGLIVSKNKIAKDFITLSNVDRKENTVSALREWCALLVCRISSYTGLNVGIVNQIEWHIGRSVCIENVPDCYLENSDSEWLHPQFNKCPFYNTCFAVKYDGELLKIKEPRYTGTSY